MEFDFDLNKVLPNTITFVDHKRCPFRNHAQNVTLLRKQLDKVIDSLGGASSKAQGLHTVITTAVKLQHSDHELYILKDAEANGGRGAAVGMIKVGRKTLFLMDIHGIQNEVIPLCVMDFYVHHSRQRNGCGKKLFEHILQIHNLQPAQVAIDRPSYKFLSFLKKHYGLQNSISQPNNFLVFDQFFRDLNAVGYVPRRSQRMRSISGNPSNRPPVHPYKRNSANVEQQQAPSQPPRRLSSRRTSRKEESMDVDPDDSPSTDAMKTVLPPLVRPPSRENSAGSVRSTDGSGSRESSGNARRGLIAQAGLYSRHGSADMIRRDTNSRAGQTLNRKALSAGTIKSLHASSQDNPLAINHRFYRKSPTTMQHYAVQSPSSTRSNLAHRDPTNSATKGTGNYTLTSVLSSQIPSGSTSRGTSWNVFGIPPVEANTKSSPQAAKYARTFPF